MFEHRFERHQQGIATAIQQAGDHFLDQLYAIADWFTTQPAIDLNKIQQGDRPDLSPAEIQRLANMAYDALRLPIVAALQRAKAKHEITIIDDNMAAMALVSLAQSTRNIPHMDLPMRKRLGHWLVDMLMNGWRPR